MPYSTPIKSMHIAGILYWRFCRHCKATNSVQWHSFCVSYKHSNGNGLLFHMTQPTSRSTMKAIACS